MEYLTLIAVPVITGVVYVLIEILKKMVNNNEKFLKFIPLIALVLGSISGAICYFFIPNIIPASNLVVSIIIGAASGLAATGTNQVIKQLTK